MGIRQELLDPLLHMTTIFLTAAKKTKDLTHGTIFFQHRIRRSEQTVRVRTVCCAGTDRTGKEDNNESCLIEMRVPLRLSTV